MTIPVLRTCRISQGRRVFFLSCSCRNLAKAPASVSFVDKWKHRRCADTRLAGLCARTLQMSVEVFEGFVRNFLRHRNDAAEGACGIVQLQFSGPIAEACPVKPHLN